MAEKRVNVEWISGEAPRPLPTGRITGRDTGLIRAVFRFREKARGFHLAAIKREAGQRQFPADRHKLAVEGLCLLDLETDFKTGIEGTGWVGIRDRRLQRESERMRQRTGTETKRKKAGLLPAFS